MSAERPPRCPKCDTPTDGNHCPHCGHRMIPKSCSICALCGGTGIVVTPIPEDPRAESPCPCRQGGGGYLTIAARRAAVQRGHKQAVFWMGAVYPTLEKCRGLIEQHARLIDARDDADQSLSIFRQMVNSDENMARIAYFGFLLTAGELVCAAAEATDPLVKDE